MRVTLRDKAQVVPQEVLDLDLTREALVLRYLRELTREPGLETLRVKA